MSKSADIITNIFLRWQGRLRNPNHEKRMRQAWRT
jgi:hypothetical protein